MALTSLIPSLPRTLILPSKVATVAGGLANVVSGLRATPTNLDGLVFDYEGECSAELNAEITDHYSESNNFMNDHAVLKPIRVTLKGLVGELVAGPAGGGLAGTITGALQGVQNVLGTVPGLLGTRTPSGLVKLNKSIGNAQKSINQISSAVSQGKRLYNFITGGDLDTRQATVYQRLEDLWSSRIPFSIKTPHSKYKGRLFLIENVKTAQPEDSKFLSEFTVVVKEVRVANALAISSRTADEKFLQGTSPLQNRGTVPNQDLVPDVLWTPGKPGGFVTL